MTPPSSGAFGAPSSAATIPVRVRAMARLAPAVAGILGALTPLSLAAVVLGPITQQSALGDSLRVVVPITLAAGEDVPSECFKLAPAQRDPDGIPQVLFGRVVVERTPAGAQLVITSPRPVHDPVIRVTVQAGCETSLQREYTLFMDPPVIEAPVVAAESAPREAVAAPRPPAAARATARAAGTSARSAARGATASGIGAGATRKVAPPKARAATKPAPKRPPAAAADRPRLTVSSSVPVSDAGVALGALAEVDRERAQQELANSIEAETVILRQRIVELTAMVERMQQEVQAQEAAQRAADAAAKAPPPVPEPDWWEANALLLAIIVGLPLLLAAALLWTRRYGAARAGPWRPRQAPARPVPGARDPRPPAPLLRNAPAGLTRAEPVDIDLDHVDNGKPDLPPRTPPGVRMPTAPARARKPMPPEPSAAARPVQESIRFELDPERAARDGDGKQGS
jgi:hypothetical protein